MEALVGKIKGYLWLFLTMLKIGLFTFGGGYAMIALLENEFVEKKKGLEKMNFWMLRRLPNLRLVLLLSMQQLTWDTKMPGLSAQLLLRLVFVFRLLLLSMLYRCSLMPFFR